MRLLLTLPGAIANSHAALEAGATRKLPNSEFGALWMTAYLSRSDIDTSVLGIVSLNLYNSLECQALRQNRARETVSLLSVVSWPA